MAEYVIRGGEEGKARLRVIGSALDRSTVGWLEVAGIDSGMRCLDVGCGGGDVTLAMGRLVGSTGRALGIDMDPVKIDLARRDATDEHLANVEFRVGDAAALDAVAEFGLVYARLLLTHLADPLSALEAMVRAVEPGGVVVIEDLDHSAVFAHPRCVALEEYVAIYNEAARRRGGDPEIGPSLFGMLGRVGLVDARLNVVHPAFVDGGAKHIHEYTLEMVAGSVTELGLATDDELRSLAARMAAFADDPDTIISFPRSFQVFGCRPATKA